MCIYAFCCQIGSYIVCLWKMGAYREIDCIFKKCYDNKYGTIIYVICMDLIYCLIKNVFSLTDMINYVLNSMKIKRLSKWSNNTTKIIIINYIYYITMKIKWMLNLYFTLYCKYINQNCWISTTPKYKCCENILLLFKWIIIYLLRILLYHIQKHQELRVFPICCIKDKIYNLY